MKNKQTRKASSELMKSKESRASEQWFGVDRDGLQQQGKERGPATVFVELISNSLDERGSGVTEISVTAEPVAGKPFVAVQVEDNSPRGYGDSVVGYEITKTGLICHGGWTPDLWEAAGREIAVYQKGLMWLVGDWLNAGDREGYVERGKLAEACERFGIEYDSAADAARVAAAYECRERSQHLDWSHHRVVANDPQAANLLQWAVMTCPHEWNQCLSPG